MTVGSYRICKRLGFDTYSVYSIETGEKLAGPFSSLADACHWIHLTS